MSEDWASGKVSKLRQQILDQKEKERLELHRRDTIAARADGVMGQVLDDISASVSRFNSLRDHELFGHPEVPELNFTYIRQQHGARVTAPRAILEVRLDRQSPAVNYTVSRSPDTPAASASTERGQLDFVLEGDQVWLRSKGGDNLSAPAAADFLLDLVI